MSRILRYDRSLLVTVMALSTLGLIMIYSSSSVLALTRKGASGYFFVRQGIFMLLGLVIMLVLMKIPYTIWQRREVVLGLISLEAILLLVALVSPAINGAHRWIRVGPITIQPSESAKLVLVIFTAYMLDKRLKEKKGWMPILVILGSYLGFIGAAILKQPDLGTCVVLAAIFLSLLFLDGVPLKGMAVLGVAGAILLAVFVVSSPYRFQRLITFLNPGADPQGAGFQARQALIAVGSGGVSGRWLEGGSQRLMFLPEPHTDFIYAMIGEELGIIGTTAVLAGFLLVGFLGIRTMVRLPADAHFAALLAGGITSWILLQGIIHIGVNLTLLPTKGLPLPFLSYGGSSLLVSLAGMGILLNVSQYKT